MSSGGACRVGLGPTLPLHQPVEDGVGVVHLDQPLAIDHPDPRRHAADEGAVVADEKAGGALLQQLPLQRLLPLDVEVVGRLVQQVEGRPGQPQSSMASRARCPPDSRSTGAVCRSTATPAPASSARARASPTSEARVTASIGVGAASTWLSPGR